MKRPVPCFPNNQGTITNNDSREGKHTRTYKVLVVANCLEKSYEVYGGVSIKFGIISHNPNGLLYVHNMPGE
jgi:hypothetical protein